MKICREINGEMVEIELTPQEMRQVYDELHADYQREDIINKMSEKCADALPSEFFGELFGEDISIGNSDSLDEFTMKTTRLVDDYLSGNDNYWECYWDSISAGIDDVVKELNIDDVQVTVSEDANEVFHIMNNGTDVATVDDVNGEIWVFDPAFVMSRNGSEAISKALIKESN